MGETVRSLMKIRENTRPSEETLSQQRLLSLGVTTDDVVDGEMMTNGDDIQILLHSLRIL